jgi:hypothetical protein
VVEGEEVTLPPTPVRNIGTSQARYLAVSPPRVPINSLDSEIPASTAPARIEQDGRSKRKRSHTLRYKQAVGQGYINELQHGKEN